MRQEKDGGIDTYSQNRTDLEITAPWIVAVMPVCARHRVSSDHHGHEQGLALSVAQGIMTHETCLASWGKDMVAEGWGPQGKRRSLALTDILGEVRA